MELEENMETTMFFRVWGLRTNREKNNTKQPLRQYR